MMTTNRQMTVPLYLREFPDFGALDVELPEGFEDTSWHNNTAPTWSAMDLVLWIDYANRELREIDGGQRFMLEKLLPNGESCGTDEAFILQTDNWQDILDYVAQHRVKYDRIKTLARRFAEQMRDNLTNAEYKQLVARNKDETNEHICHSHDFLDANMTMLDAWHDVLHRDHKMTDDADRALWDHAWTLAKAAHFDPKLV